MELKHWAFLLFCFVFQSTTAIEEVKCPLIIHMKPLTSFELVSNQFDFSILLAVEVDFKFAAVALDNTTTTSTRDYDTILSIYSFIESDVTPTNPNALIDFSRTHYYRSSSTAAPSSTAAHTFMADFIKKDESFYKLIVAFENLHSTRSISIMIQNIRMGFDPNVLTTRACRSFFYRLKV